jgi:hypothetical protein
VNKRFVQHLQEIFAFFCLQKSFGDPGTGAPSFLGIGTVGLRRTVSISEQDGPLSKPIALSRASPHMRSRRPAADGVMRDVRQ